MAGAGWPAHADASTRLPFASWGSERALDVKLFNSSDEDIGFGVSGSRVPLGANDLKTYSKLLLTDEERKDVKRFRLHLRTTGIQPSARPG